MFQEDRPVRKLERYGKYHACYTVVNLKEKQSARERIKEALCGVGS